MKRSEMALYDQAVADLGPLGQVTVAGPQAELDEDGDAFLSDLCDKTYIDDAQGRISIMRFVHAGITREKTFAYPNALTRTESPWRKV